MKMTKTPSTPAQQGGVVLLEALIAILIFSFGVLGLVGLQASMVKNTSEAKYRSTASYIAQQRIGEMWADPAHLPPEDLNQDIDISAQLPGGIRRVTQDPANLGQYLVEVFWQQPGESQRRFQAVAVVAGG